MKYITLRGKLARSMNLEAIVDDEDYEMLSKHKWHAVKSITKSNGTLSTFYAASQNMTSMHRMILGITDRKKIVDHKNRNGLDNQKHNLRECTQSQNLGNAKLHITNTSGFRGVYKTKSGKWMAAISSGTHSIKRLGLFNTKEEAAIAYDVAATEKYGEFASLNFKKPAPTLAG